MYTCAAPMTQTKNMADRIMKVRGMVVAHIAGSVPSSFSMRGAKMSEPAPNPRTARPTITTSMTSGPATAVRFWTGHALDVLARCRENTRGFAAGSKTENGASA